jgi:hypothetical protein
MENEYLVLSGSGWHFGVNQSQVAFLAKTDPKVLLAMGLSLTVIALILMATRA